MSLEALIKQRIRAQGPISVADYMALALAHPEYGYYMRKDPLGAQGDFITAPEISQIFGELMGAFLAQQWLVMGRPQAVLAELGPGRGTLMADALRATRHVPGFHDAISVHLVETSPALREKQWAALAGRHPRLNWHAGINELPQQPLLLVANEFFDALPIRQFCAGVERMVGLDENGHLTFTGNDAPITETCEPALAITTDIASRLCRDGGAALIIDYGYNGGSRGDTLQAVKQHQYHDILADPGSADLTAHVDFAALKQAALQQGARTYGAMPQSMFLHQLGAPLRIARLVESAPHQKSAMLSALERLTSPDQMGDLFKVLCLTAPGHPQPEPFEAT